MKNESPENVYFIFYILETYRAPVRGGCTGDASGERPTRPCNRFRSGVLCKTLAFSHTFEKGSRVHCSRRVTEKPFVGSDLREAGNRPVYALVACCSCVLLFEVPTARSRLYPSSANYVSRR